MIGITRQTISSIENKSREMSWPTFLSLLFLFSKNSDTQTLMKAMGIYDENLETYGASALSVGRKEGFTCPEALVLLGSRSA